MQYFKLTIMPPLSEYVHCCFVSVLLHPFNMTLLPDFLSVTPIHEPSRIPPPDSEPDCVASIPNEPEWRQINNKTENKNRNYQVVTWANRTTITTTTTATTTTATTWMLGLILINICQPLIIKVICFASRICFNSGLDGDASLHFQS